MRKSIIFCALHASARTFSSSSCSKIGNQGLAKLSSFVNSARSNALPISISSFHSSSSLSLPYPAASSIKSFSKPNSTVSKPSSFSSSPASSSFFDMDLEGSPSSSLEPRIHSLRKSKDPPLSHASDNKPRSPPKQRLSPAETSKLYHELRGKIMAKIKATDCDGSFLIYKQMRDQSLHPDMEVHEQLMKLQAANGQPERCYRLYISLRKDDKLTPSRDYIQALLSGLSSISPSASSPSSSIGDRQVSKAAMEALERVEKIVLQDMHKFKLSVTAFELNCALRAATHARNSATAQRLFDNLTMSYEEYLAEQAAKKPKDKKNSYKKKDMEEEDESGELEEGQEIEIRRVVPDAISYSALIHAHAQAGNTKAALSAFRSLEKEAEIRTKLLPSSSQQRRSQRPLSFFDKQREAKKSPSSLSSSSSSDAPYHNPFELKVDIMAINSLLLAFRNSADSVERLMAFELYSQIIAQKWMNKEKERGFVAKPTAHTFSILLGACRASKMPRLAENVLMEMRRASVVGDDPLLNNLIRTLGLARRGVQAHELILELYGMESFGEMENVDAPARGALTRVQVDLGAILKRDKQFFSLDEETANIALASLLVDGHTSRAVSLLELMDRVECQPDIVRNIEAIANGPKDLLTAQFVGQFISKMRNDFHLQVTASHTERIYKVLRMNHRMDLYDTLMSVFSSPGNAKQQQAEE